MIKLSILVLTVPSRLSFFYPRIMKQLLDQCDSFPEVEILGLFDNKKRTVGEKRQDLLNIARGEYLVFIDDDDRIADDYVSTIIDALINHPETDCVVFDCICTTNNSKMVYGKYGIEYDYYEDTVNNMWYGKPAHTMVYKSSIAKEHVYSSTNFGEDVDWVKRACIDIKHQTRIDKVLYYYDFIENVSETRTHNKHISEPGKCLDNVINESNMNYLKTYTDTFGLKDYSNHDNNVQYQFAIDELSKIFDVNDSFRLIDIGSGRGQLIGLVKNKFKNVNIISVDLNKFHDFECTFVTCNLSNEIDRNKITTNTYDVLTCLDVFEHLDKTFIRDVILMCAKLSKTSIISIANHSDIINGVELHTIQENDSWWELELNKFYEVMNKTTQYNGILYMYNFKSKFL